MSFENGFHGTVGCSRSATFTDIRNVINKSKFIIHVLFLGNSRPQLKDIENYVVIKCATNWKQLGKSLDIDDDWLNIFEKDNPHNCVNCCSRMLSEWLDSNPDASWAILLDAVNKTQNALNKEPEKLADKLPDIVGKLDSAADKLPKAVDQLCETIDKLPEVVSKVHNVEGTNSDNFTGNYDYGRYVAN